MHIPPIPRIRHRVVGRDGREWPVGDLAEANTLLRRLCGPLLFWRELVVDDFARCPVEFTASGPVYTDRFRVETQYGEPIPVDVLRAAGDGSPSRRRHPSLPGHRDGAWPGTGGHGNWRGRHWRRCRCPMRLRRASPVEAIDEIGDRTVRVAERGLVPETRYDEMPRHRERSWKAQRRTRWRRPADMG